MFLSEALRLRLARRRHLFERLAVRLLKRQVDPREPCGDGTLHAHQAVGVERPLERLDHHLRVVLRHGERPLGAGIDVAAASREEHDLRPGPLLLELRAADRPIGVDEIEPLVVVPHRGAVARVREQDRERPAVGARYFHHGHVRIGDAVGVQPEPPGAVGLLHAPIGPEVRLAARQL